MIPTVGGGGVMRWRRRRAFALGFAVALALGVAVYLRIWALDSSSSSSVDDDREALRRQFDRANMEAMDESAEWRRKYDGEVQKNWQLEEELKKVKSALAAATSRSEALQKENNHLRSQLGSMKHGVQIKEDA